jgi:hypothetical protein
MTRSPPSGEGGDGEVAAFARTRGRRRRVSHASEIVIRPHSGECGYGECGYGECGYGECGYGECGYGEGGYGEGSYGSPARPRLKGCATGGGHGFSLGRYPQSWSSS